MTMAGHRHSGINNYSPVPDQKKCQTALAWSGTRPVPASLVFFILVPDCLDAGMLGILAFIHTNTNTHTNTHTHKHTPVMCGMNMDRNMDVQHGHEAWTRTCTMDMEMDKHHGCRNADKMFSPASLVLR
jgi:hypothetical protein